MAVLCVTLLLISLDNTILNVALPSIVRSLHATSTQLQWIVDAFAVFFAGLLLTFGALGDRVGRKWVFMGGLVVFGVGSALAAWSGTPDRLTAARAVMGVGAAALMPCTLSILTNVFTADRDRARAIGIWSGTAGLGVAIGPMLGGFLLVHYWWGSVFLINVPIAAVGLAMTAFLVPNSKSPHARRPDPLGAVLSIVGVSLLLWGIIEAPNRTWTSPLVVGALASSVVIIIGFVVWERSIDHPMLPLEFFGNRRYSAAIASLALLLFALLGLFFLFTQYLQFGLGFSPSRRGSPSRPLPSSCCSLPRPRFSSHGDLVASRWSSAAFSSLPWDSGSFHVPPCTARTRTRCRRLCSSASGWALVSPPPSSRSWAPCR